MASIRGVMLFAVWLILGVTISIQGPADGYKRVCYYTGWAQYRPAPYKFFPENVDPHLCTHIIYSFFLLQWNTFTIKPDEWNAETMIERLVALKNENPTLKVMIAVGGWSQGSAVFSFMASEAATRSTFVTSVVATLDRLKLDGLDVDWEYPGSNGGAAKDKANLVLLLKELKEALVSKGYILSLAAAAGYDTISRAYDPLIVQYLDFFNVMAYDYHGSWESLTGHNAPMTASPNTDRRLCIRETIRIYEEEIGVPPSKIILGIPTYGRSWNLTGSSQTPGSPGEIGPSTTWMRQPGYTSFFEICRNSPFVPMWDEIAEASYLVQSNSVWITYENERSLNIKINYLMNKGFGGAMIWALDLDDFINSCGGGYYPLIGRVKQLLESNTAPSITTTTSTTTTTTTPTTTTTTSTSTPVVIMPPKLTKEQCLYYTDHIHRWNVEGWENLTYGLYANVENCAAYKVCFRNLVCFPATCEDGKMFDPVIGDCVDRAQTSCDCARNKF